METKYVGPRFKEHPKHKWWLQRGCTVKPGGGWGVMVKGDWLSLHILLAAAIWELPLWQLVEAFKTSVMVAAHTVDVNKHAC